MEDFPPSYELATTRDVWAIVADYIPSADLCAASLVCRRWHEIFVPFLWGAPASHFGTDNDAVYVALTRFRRTLKRARLEVRMLTHTFHLPPALSEIYGGPRPSWLQEVLEYLPNLQSLLVSQLPFFDHNSLIALRPKSNDETSYEAYGLRLLMAQREPNTTSVGVREALLRFPLLVYLDLSFTTSARDHGVLSAMSYLKDLQVLKLRGIGLRDADLEVVADSIKPESDCWTPLLQKCFLPLDAADVPSPTDRDVKFHFEWARSISPFANILGPDSLKNDDFDTHLMKQLMIPLTGRSNLQDLPHVGITHLYISDNRLSVEGLGSLLKSTRLHVLDGGTVKSAGSMWKRKGFEPITDNESQWVVGVRYPGAEKLIPALRHSAADKLTYLRVHHAVVTENTSASSRQSVPVTRTPYRRLACSAAAVELDSSSSQIYELQGGYEPVRHELADTSFQRPIPGWRPGWRSNSNIPPSTPENELQKVASVQPPSLSPSSSIQPRTDQILTLLHRRPINSNGTVPFFHPSHTPHLRTLVLTDVPASVLPSSSHIISRLIRFITACADEAFLAALQARSNYSLPPGRLRANAERQHARSLFSLERIILEVTPVAKPEASKGSTSWSSSGAGFFSKSSTEDVDSENLWAAAENDFSFFSGETEVECGVPDEEFKDMDDDRDPEVIHSPQVAELDATATTTTSSSYPTTTTSQRNSQILHHRPTPTPTPPPSSSRSPSLPNRTSASSPPPAAPPAPPSSSHQQQRQQTNSATSPQDTDIDVVAALAAFRKTKKAEYDELFVHGKQGKRRSTTSTSTPTATSARTPTSPRSLASSSSSSSWSSSSSSSSSSSGALLNHPLYVAGYWKGEVKIVRNPMPKGRRSGGFVDIYGNYFERGYLYP
ncbi:hypothetical protein ACJ72_04786 [Emergomyces africanus]|uniref:F-box domain-containing protein n=1 Tax=Emergomyces africanus TaxID=1955775 RepID=A0A1B7NVS8_9EURO|nr:hypothetical protein ACJ72_04786 [Emergomyces africanus]